MTGVLIKGGNLAAKTYIEGRQCEKTKGEAAHLQIKEKGPDTSFPHGPLKKLTL